MPFNGSGVYSAPSLPGSWNPAQTGQQATPADWNTLLADLSAALSLVICRDGQSTITGDIDFNSNKITALADGTADTDGVNVGQMDAAIAAGLSGAIPTGVIWPYVGTTAPTGWILCFGTIGNASSSATNRANADTETLFTLLWNSWANAEAPVSGGRGASAAADYAANKTIAIPDLRGRGIFGKDNMGGSAASRITGGSTLGLGFGNQNHTHTVTSTGTGSGSTGTGTTDFNSGVIVFAGGGGGEASQNSHTHPIPSLSVTVSSISVSGTTANPSTFPVPGLILNMIIKL